jgi:hypothetical protein
VFALLFFLQGLGFALVASARQLPFRFRWRPGVQSVVGAALIGYAFVLYPLVDLLMGSWPRMPAFGISPCPVTLFTLGLLLLGQPRPRWWLWIIPVAWSLLGGTAAFLLGIPQDWVLLLGGPAALLIAFGRLPARPAPSNPIR